MHYHLEIVMPPVPADKVEEAVSSVLAPFDENGKGEDDEANPHAFWDFWTIGGRWTGAKLTAAISPERLKAFHAAMSEKKFTVAGVRSGKQELRPESQAVEADALWLEHFPELPVTRCPIFQHADGDLGTFDVCKLGDVSPCVTCDHVIFAGPPYSDGTYAGAPEAKEMLETFMWNGVTHVGTAWDGTLAAALTWREDRASSRAAPEYLAASTPTDDWLAVTVDYHS